MALRIYRGESLHGGHPGQAAQAPHSRRTQSWTVNGAARGGGGDPKTDTAAVGSPAAHNNRVRVLLQTAKPGTHTQRFCFMWFSVASRH